MIVWTMPVILWAEGVFAAVAAGAAVTKRPARTAPNTEI
jgi:acyl-CoA reductase-like NAD-dependent aldehyde dehydrogenase